MVGPRYHPSLMHLSQVRGLISPHFLRLGLLCVRERESAFSLVPFTFTPLPSLQSACAVSLV
jgi:hypothetical protein